MTIDWPIATLPADTAYAARAQHGPEYPYLVVGDRLEALCGGLPWGDLAASSHSSLDALAIHALVTAFQYVEGLCDRQAADATRTRVDWKYALHLPLNYPGLDPFRLAEFREDVARAASGHALCSMLLTRLAGTGLFAEYVEPGPGFECVLAAVDRINRVDRVAAAMAEALEVLAATFPAWLRDNSLSHWFSRYSQAPAERARKGEEEAWLAAAQDDMRYLLQALNGAEGAALAEVRVLREIWERERGRAARAE